MISFDKTEVMNFHNAMRGARNPLNSWNRMDSHISDEGDFVFGENDLGLAKRLINAGTDHRKFIRQIFISVDITAPLYWWKEYDTYKVGTVANSTSTMHKIHSKEFDVDDFSHDHLTDGARKVLDNIIVLLEDMRKEYVEKFKDDKILIIGQFLTHLEILAKLLNVPIITGKTKNSERDIIYDDFRSGKIRVLVVSKVANFAIDLPDASMAIQVSGTFGSRQEEAQRLGRILRPKERTSRFFTLITRGTVEEDFGSNRQKFLAEQGYSYRIIRYENEKSFDELEVPIQIEGCGQ